MLSLFALKTSVPSLLNWTCSEKPECPLSVRTCQDPHLSDQIQNQHCRAHQREIGNLLPNNRRQRRTCYALCHILYPVSAAHTSIFRMDSNSTSYAHITTTLSPCAPANTPIYQFLSAMPPQSRSARPHRNTRRIAGLKHSHKAAHYHASPPWVHTSISASTSQIFTRWSSDPLTTRLPSGENATERTRPE